MMNRKMMKRNDGNAELTRGSACISGDFQLPIQAGSSCRALVRTAKLAGQCEGAAAATSPSGQLYSNRFCPHPITLELRNHLNIYALYWK